MDATDSPRSSVDVDCPRRDSAKPRGAWLSWLALALSSTAIAYCAWVHRDSLSAPRSANPEQEKGHGLVGSWNLIATKNAGAPARGEAHWHFLSDGKIIIDHGRDPGSNDKATFLVGTYSHEGNLVHLTLGQTPTRAFVVEVLSDRDLVLSEEKENPGAPVTPAPVAAPPPRVLYRFTRDP